MNVERPQLVLAVYPNARGLAFVLFEGPNALVDWGITDLRRSERHERCVRFVESLLEKHRPDILVFRDMPGGPKADLARQFIEVAKREGIPAVAASRKEVRQAFSGLGRAPRHAIVSEIVRRLPMFASFQPGRRKIWNGEDRRMGLFDAAALAIAFFTGQSDLYPGTSRDRTGLHTDLQTLAHYVCSHRVQVRSGKTRPNPNTWARGALRFLPDLSQFCLASFFHFQFQRSKRPRLGDPWPSRITHPRCRLITKLKGDRTLVSRPRLTATILQLTTWQM